MYFYLPCSKKFLPLFFSLLFIGLLNLGTSTIKKAGYHLTYSATSSMPRGFYLVTPQKKFTHHEVVEFRPPLHILNLIQENHWLPPNGSMIKYVFAVPSDHVCIHHQTLWVNHKKIAPIYKFYAPNKLLPQTKICGRLQEGQYLLLSTENERSFDGRYFGPVSQQKILGRAKILVGWNINKDQ